MTTIPSTARPRPLPTIPADVAPAMPGAAAGGTAAGGAAGGGGAGKISPDLQAILDQLRAYMNGACRLIACEASGTNVITLTPRDPAPLIPGYVSYDTYVFVAAQTSTGLVTMTVAPVVGTLATLKAYKTNGAAQATTGDVVQNSLYLAIFADHLDSNAGGFVLK